MVPFSLFFNRGHKNRQSAEADVELHTFLTLLRLLRRPRYSNCLLRESFNTFFYVRRPQTSRPGRSCCCLSTREPELNCQTIVQQHPALLPTTGAFRSRVKTRLVWRMMWWLGLVRDNLRQKCYQLHHGAARFHLAAEANVAARVGEGSSPTGEQITKLF